MGLEDPCHLRGPVQLVETQFPRFAGILGIRRRRHGDGARTSSKQGSAERSLRSGGGGDAVGAAPLQTPPPEHCARTPRPLTRLRPSRCPVAGLSPGTPGLCRPGPLGPQLPLTPRLSLPPPPPPPPWPGRCDPTSLPPSLHPTPAAETSPPSRRAWRVPWNRVPPPPRGAHGAGLGVGVLVRARGEPEGGAPLRGADDDLQLPPSRGPGSPESRPQLHLCCWPRALRP